ncbi:SPOR domain-containing protein [Ancylobacter sp. 6x-1]|uniref:SPOR domain-containing protein n=1 Tax=Ancylobacter crimeensis TaxID=2579147 RepID=A0ABT0DCA4_9HYPH|nr:serine hydrolase [Ancylobacter crimeensis]MCK0197579.1 SPOR domain-containing protein [Ancylobacter crimeensis]
MRVPAKFGTYCLRAGAVLMALAVAGTGVAEAKTKKRKAVSHPAVTRHVAATPRATASRPAVVDTRVWQRGYADIVVDANTGEVLHAENADALRHPASLTKVMTLYMLFEQLGAGKVRLDSELTVSQRAAAQSPTKLGLRPGTTISVEDAIKGIVTRSANDAAMVIAENLAGDSETFAAMMTRKARSLGMSRTVFRNPNGLPDPQQVTTAHDLAILGRSIQERFPRYYPYFATKTFYYRGAAIGNHNRLLGKVEGVDGIKTGYTNASGFNLLTNVRRDGRHLVAVVLGGATAVSRDQKMTQLVASYLPRAYAGRQTVAPIAENSTTQMPLPMARAAEVAPLPAPAVAEREPSVTATLPPTRVASAQTDDATDEGESEDDAAPAAQVQAAAPAPTAAATRVMYVAPSKPLPEAGSAAPIVPTPVKTVAVPRPSRPVATMGGAPGTLGTLTFAAASMGGSLQPVARPARAPVQVASAGPITLPASASTLPPAKSTARQAAIQAAVARTGWGIQIGAFGSEEDARAHMSKAKSLGGAALKKAEPYTETTQNGMVRARFAGFDAESSARGACKSLKRGAISCMVFRN